MAVIFHIVMQWVVTPCTTSLKVSGSIPGAVIRLFNLLHSSSCITVLESTQSLTEMSTRNLPGCKGQSAREADKLPAICEPIVYKMWEPRHLTTLWASTAYYGDSFTFTLE
jgi:hypothetical protein